MTFPVVDPTNILFMAAGEYFQKEAKKDKRASKRALKGLKEGKL